MMKSERIKDIIIAIMAVVILVLTGLLFFNDSGRYCRPVGIGKQPAAADTLRPDTPGNP